MENYRILIVEDEIIIAAYLKELLTRLDFEVLDMVSNGEDAIQKALQHKPDLILMDILLSGNLDGIETAEAINEKSDIPIVYLTGNADINTVKRARESKPFGYILKPVNVQDLYSTIDTAIRRSELERKLIETNQELEKRNKMILESELKLVQKESIMKVMINSHKEAIFLIDREGIIIEANEEITRRLGKSYEELIGKNVFGLLPKELSESRKKNINEAIMTKKSIFFEDQRNSRNYENFVYPIFDQNGEVDKLSILAIDITERKKTFYEKEILLSEIHHRVKNNMQIIISLMSLQSQQIDDKVSQEKFNDSISRIKSMALVQENLYNNNDFDNIELSSYINKLIVEVNYAHRLNENVKFNINTENIQLNIEQAIPCGLMLNEILTNSFKFAFPENWKADPVINITAMQKDGIIEICISDNGIGIRGKRLIENKTLGMSLINLLITQLKGEIDFNFNEGTSYKIRFKGASLI